MLAYEFQIGQQPSIDSDKDAKENRTQGQAGLREKQSRFAVDLFKDP